VIRDLTETLGALLDDPALAADFPELSDAATAFDRPADGFNPAHTTIDLFLYDVREDLELRNSEPLRTTLNGGVQTRPAPLRVLCSYLVTAWPVGGTDLALQEHRLLAQALQVLARNKQIPGAFLKGSLAGQTPPLPMMTAQADGLKNPHEFWTAIGNRMRPSIHVTATIAMDLFPPVVAPAVITSGVHLGLRAPGSANGLAASAGPPRFRIGGRITDAAALPLTDAQVSLVEVGLAARTDDQGRYQLGVMTAGTYTLRVEQNAVVKNVAVTVPLAAAGSYDVQL
jgi:hypothetical protein